MAAETRSPGELLAAIRDGWPGSRWEWDGRFGCALATVDAGGEARAREVLAGALPQQWTADTVGGAPAPVSQVCSRTGGLRGEQLILSGAAADGTTAYCLWWPWGGGKNFSARVGITGGTADPKAALKTAFGV